MSTDQAPHDSFLTAIPKTQITVIGNYSHYTV